MTWTDPIVEEVRRSRDAYAARFDYDLRAIYLDLKNRERQSGRKIVSSAESAAEIEPNRTPQSIGLPSIVPDSVLKPTGPTANP
jgi:hypothetical protein